MPLIQAPTLHCRSRLYRRRAHQARTEAQEDARPYQFAHQMTRTEWPRPLCDECLAMDQTCLHRALASANALLCCEPFKRSLTDGAELILIHVPEQPVFE